MVLVMILIFIMQTLFSSCLSSVPCFAFCQSAHCLQTAAWIPLGSCSVKSLMKSMHRVGERTLPCIKPCYRSTFQLWCQSISHLDRLLCKLDLVHQYTPSSMLQHWSFTSNLSFHKSSKAFKRSMRTTRITFWF